MADVLNYPRGGGKTAKMYEVIGIAEAKRLGIISDRLAHDIRMSKAGFLFRIENGKEYKFYKVNRIQPKESESKMLVHKTKEGKHILIGQMDDDHLFNYVNLVIKASLEIKGISTDSMTPFQRVMLGMPEVRQEDSAEQVRLHIVKLYPYFTEMILRDHPKLSKVSKMLQSLMERKDAVPSKLLPKNIIGPGAQETQIDEIEELVEVEVIED